jgi:hypothetical protein
MARLRSDLSYQLEMAEGCLSALGNARVYLSLVAERVEIAVQTTGQSGLLDPALSDLKRAQALILSAQKHVSSAFSAGDKS